MCGVDRLSVRFGNLLDQPVDPARLLAAVHIVLVGPLGVVDRVVVGDDPGVVDAQGFSGAGLAAGGVVPVS